jgi:hypothetical protein
MRRVRRRRALARTAAAGLLLCATALATSYRELTLTEILASAEVGFVATVAATSVEMRVDLPWTVVEFDVERRLAGPARAGEAFRLSFLGGTRTAGEGLQVNLMPQFEVGERVLILAYDEEYYSPIVGFDQGLWRQQGQVLVDARGRRLGLDDDGRLLADGGAGEPALVIDAVARELEAR